LPWRESYCDVVQIAEDDTGNIDEKDLEEKLKLYAGNTLPIKSVKNRSYAKNRVFFGCF
jgi:hypothetical protein